jgi:hypothetical protein
MESWAFTMRSIVGSVRPEELKEGGEHAGPSANLGAHDDTAKELDSRQNKKET